MVEDGGAAGVDGFGEEDDGLGDEDGYCESIDNSSASF